MNKILAKIPAKSLSEFFAKQTLFIKNRVRLLSVLAICLYFFSSIISLLAYPEDFNPAEIPIFIVLLLGGAVIIYFNNKAKTLNIARLNAYLFVALILVLLTKASIVYSQYAELSASIYVFTLFLIVSTIPWMPLEVVPITLMHVAAYSFLFFCVQTQCPDYIKEIFGPRQFFEGVSFILMASVICVVIRSKETVRDVENFILLKEVETKNKQMHEELELATIVHKTLVPKAKESKLLDIAVTYLPAYYLGGDYANYHFLGKDKVVFIICDITGHGVSSALLVNRIHTEFELSAKNGKDPGALLNEINDFILEDFKGTNMYLSAFCGLLDFKNRKLIYSNHGHPDQYIYLNSKSILQPLKSQAPLLGLPFVDKKICQDEIRVGSGDQILLFTDGVLDVINKDNEHFETKRLESFINYNHSLRAVVFNERLKEELERYKKDSFKDDIFLFNMKIK